MEIDAPSSRKINQESTTDQFIVDLDLEAFINQGNQIGKDAMIQEEEP